MKETRPENKKIIIIPKEEAVFRMDKNGTWHNEHGKFEHPRIIRYFNTAIKKDENGYYVHQATGECEEKVYFPYEDTALFIVDILAGQDIGLILNTAQKMTLEQGYLFMESDTLYLITPDHKIKFSSHALVKLSKFIEEKNGKFSIKINEKAYPVQSSDKD
ncbi:MAG: MFS transporter permease [Desulfobacterales bacterium RIFOXYA12_FULL_46_15]|nr:MAG: MFS transporter permease [Desulfobacula sp. GWF2_41_7]OGR23832.1 MAG: MFS transporter permease [Desulfobacterales bacterium RIFOXYA12_FULL_46_15]